eukprot:Sdes_comp17990_c0_seq1m7252
MLGILTCMARGATHRVMTSKFGKKNYYKGKGCKPTGFHTKHGRYVVLKNRIPEFIVPDLQGFSVSSTFMNINFRMMFSHFWFIPVFIFYPFQAQTLRIS